MSRHHRQHLSSPVYHSYPAHSPYPPQPAQAPPRDDDSPSHHSHSPLSQGPPLSHSQSQPPILPRSFLPPPAPHPRDEPAYRLDRARIPSIIIPRSPYAHENGSHLHGGSPYEQPPVLPPLSAGSSSLHQSIHRPPSSSGAPLHPHGAAFGHPSPGSHSNSPYNAQFHGVSLSNPHSASLSSSLGDRVLRSPHPPLTATFHPGQQFLWPPPLPHIDTLRHSHSHSQSYPYTGSLSHSNSPAAGPDASSSRPYYPHTPTVPAPLPYREHYASNPPTHRSSPYLPPPTPSSYATYPRTTSPFHIPPPLRFNYSASPPPALSSGASSSHTYVHPHPPPPHTLPPHSYPPPALADMPPRKKAAAATDAPSTSGGTSTPRTLSTTAGTAAAPGTGGSVTRARRGANGKGWTMEHTYDSVGHPKEVIVIDDSASPMVQPIRKRTRAQVAAEQQQQQQAMQQQALQHQQAAMQQAGYAGGSAYSQSSVSLSNGHAGSVATTGTAAGGSAKKRKLDDDQGKKAKPKVASTASGSTQTTGTYVSQQQVAPKAAQYQAKAAPNSNQPAAPPAWDDAEGHYIVKPDDIIGGRYKIVRLLGQGTFGKVVEARHIDSRKKVAVKVIRAVQKYREASKIEIRVLETLKKHDARNDNKCIHLEEWFDFRNHPCLVSELYGMSVFDFLKQNSFQPFPDKHIQDFAKSLLKSVAYLHSLKLVHTDLKPENILLCSNESRLVGPRARGQRSKSILRNTEIRLIDFGSATFENEYHSSVVSTRHYRAPEIILGLPWSYPCDMFSIGCILVEFYTGSALFQTHDNLEHLAMMEVVMGKFSTRMIEKGRAKKPEFFKGNKIDFPNASVSKASRKYVKSLHTLKQTIEPTNKHQQLFLDLCTRLLEHDPDVRIKVQDALRHPYLTEPIPDPA
ncbi:hypothetical protein IAT38_008109 [Cryptococcus sp. DSM 104549]